MPTSKVVFFFASLIWGAYIASRTLILRLLPATDWSSYLIQDFFVSLARLGCALSILWLGLRRWSAQTLGLTRLHLGSRLAWLAATLLLVAAAFGILSHPHLGDQSIYPWSGRVIETLVAFVVAFNEELAFRGVFYRALREMKGPVWAVWLPSLVFAVLHLGYQPFNQIPGIFLFGLTLAWLRERGTSLSSLILIHFIFDGIYALSAPGPGISHGYYLASLACAALAGLAAWRATIKRLIPSKVPLLFVYGTLRRGQTAAKAFNLEGRAEYLGSFEVKGKLMEVEGYPALRVSKKDRDRSTVPGELLALHDPDLLRELDAYEGENYLRDKIELNEKIEAWTYLLA